MNLLFIADAYAGGGGAMPPPTAGSLAAQLIIIVVGFFLAFFIFIRPQQRRERERKEMLNTLAKGDEVTTTGGLVGRVIDLGEYFVMLDVGKGIQLKIQRGAIEAILPKGTTKTL